MSLSNSNDVCNRSTSDSRINRNKYEFISSTINRWKKMPESSELKWTKRLRHTMVVYENSLYAFGGCCNNMFFDDLRKFNVEDKSWSEVYATGKPPSARYLHSAVVFDNSMFIYGGRRALRENNALFQYNFKENKWVEWEFSGKQPLGRWQHCAVVYDNKMWIYGGRKKDFWFTDMWTLNLTGKNHEWNTIEYYGEQPPADCKFAVAVARDCMYLFSGQSGLRITSSLYEFNFKTKTWRQIDNDASQPPFRSYGHTMVHHDSFLYLFGGRAESTFPNHLHCYNLDSEIWSIIQPEANTSWPSGRVYHTSAVIRDALYIFGGALDYGKVFNDTYKFQLYPKCTLRDDYGKFFNEKQFCDIQFTVGLEEVKIMAHIAFVAARSEYLRTKILAALDAKQQQMEKVFDSDCIEVRTCPQGPNQEPLLEVRLPNANPEAFEILLNFIYTDRIDLKESYTKNIIILLTDVYQLAGLYLMPRLAHVCIQYLEYKINKQNVLEGLCNADKKKIQIVKDHCMHFLIKKENFTDVVMFDELSDLEQPLLVEIMRKKLNPSKIVIDNSLEQNVGTTLESDMAAFLESTGKDFYDINLVVEDQVIKAHKSILSARTQYFQAMFRSFMSPDNTVNISIGDILPSVEAFQSFLRYIYYGEIKLPPQDAVYLFQAEDFYGFSNSRLYSFCIKYINHNITCENVLQTLEASDHTGMLDIKERALKWIAKNYEKVAFLPKMSTLSHELLLDIIRTVP